MKHKPFATRETVRTILLASVFASAALLPHSAQSQLAGGCRCSTIGGFHTETRQHVTEETTEAAATIVEALRQQSRQNSNYLDRQVEANRRMADGEAQNEARLARSLVRAEAESGSHDPNPDYCLLVDAALQPRLPERNLLPGIQNIMASATDWSTGKSPPVQENGVRMAAWLRSERERLHDAGGARDATTDWEFALGEATLPMETASYREALTRLIANTVDPFPPRPLSEDDLATPAGLAEAVRRSTTEARNRAAMASIGFALALAEPVHAAEPYRTIAARSRRDFEIPEKLSEVQALDIRISAYDLPTADALELRHSKTERALLQDLVDIGALNARLAHLRLVQETRNAVVLAAMLGMLTDGTTSNSIR